VTEDFSELHVGSPGSGKSLSGARSLAEEVGASATLDPHENSLARTGLIFAKGNVLFDRLSEIKRTLGLGLMDFLKDPDKVRSERWLDMFVAILMLRTGADMASTPLREEWLIASLMLLIHQKTPKLGTLLPFAFLPGTSEFESLVSGCVLPEIKAKFRAIEKLSPRALRAELGSAARLIQGVFRSPAFQARCRGGFDIGGFLQNRGKLIVERGDEISDDAMRVIMGSIVLLVIDHAKRRPKPYPIIRVRIDEANNARLVTSHVLRGIAELRKYGLFFSFYVQNLNFPGSVDEVLQNARVHHWYGCSHYDLARKAATDVASGLARGEESRTELIAQLTEEIMRFKPGWRWSVYPSGSRKEYVPLLENPWPDWPGLREAKLQERLCQIYARPEYRVADESTSQNSSTTETLPPTSSRGDSSPAMRLKKQRENRRIDGSARSEGGSE